MKKLTLISIIVFYVLIGSGYSQNKQTKPISKTSSTSKPEIDKLAEKYKDTTYITLYTSYDELTGFVKINNNPDKKPQEVIISGHSTNKNAVEEFISDVISKKKKQGYADTENSFVSLGPMTMSDIEPYVDSPDGFNCILKKGNMYFIANVKAYDDFGENRERMYTFSIETGDNSRKGGKNATNFDF